MKYVNVPDPKLNPTGSPSDFCNHVFSFMIATKIYRSTKPLATWERRSKPFYPSQSRIVFTRVFLQLVCEVVVVKLVKFGGVYVDDLIFGLQYVFDVLPRHCRETSLHFGQNRSRGETNFLRTSCQVKIVPSSLLRTYSIFSEIVIFPWSITNFPPRFSPEDKYSRQRITVKTRFGLMPTQQPPLKY